jgi:serine/threonine-protein kinase
MSPTPGARYCASCGAAVEADSAFCTRCGKPLNASSAGGEPAGTLAPGHTVREYRVVRLVGAGGMGEVYEAVHELTGARCALKRMLAELSLNSAVEQRFVEEARIMSLLDHSNIVPLQTFFKEEGRYCLVMKYIDGTTLKDLVARLVGNDQILPVERAVAIVAPIARALHHAHCYWDEEGRRADGPRGFRIIHRDVKPSNILIDKADHPYLTDFGIAKSEDGKSLTKTGAVLGTYEFMSPEQIQGKPLTPATDQYSLGATLFAALAGQAPFPQTSTSGFECMQGHVDKNPPPMYKFRIDMPRKLDAVLRTAMDKNPDKRFGSCAQLADALEDAVRAADAELLAPPWIKDNTPKPVYGPPPDDEPKPVYGPPPDRYSAPRADHGLVPVYGPPDSSDSFKAKGRTGRTGLFPILGGAAAVAMVAAAITLAVSDKGGAERPTSRESAPPAQDRPVEGGSPQGQSKPNADVVAGERGEEKAGASKAGLEPAKPAERSAGTAEGQTRHPPPFDDRVEVGQPGKAPAGGKMPQGAPPRNSPPLQKLSAREATASDWNYRHREPGKYSADNLVDGAASTAWCKTDGVGEKLTIELAGPAVVHELRILNGYQKVANDKYGDRFSRNSRVARFSLSRAYGEPEGSFTLDDTKVWRRIELTPFRSDRISLTVESAFWGKDRSVCLSEVEVWGVDE